jgi:PAS domain S-box-containing protein
MVVGTRSGDAGLASVYGTDAAFLAQIIERVAHPIFVKDRAFRWVRLNEAFCQMVGRPRSALLGRTDYDFFPADEADFFRAKDVEVFQTRRTVVIEGEPITDGHGRRRVLATTKVPLFDAAGEITHLVGIVHDITELKRAEDALRDANEELEHRVMERTRALQAAQEDLVRKERLAVLGRLAGGVAHQIRNPLAAIKNAMYLVERGAREQGNVSEDLTAAVGIVHDEVGRANHIITSLLEYARVRPPMQQSVSLVDLVEAVLSSTPVPEVVRVRRRLGKVPVVRADPEQVRSAVDNLVKNALDAMPGGGTLAVETRSEVDDVVLSVGDTGGGIDPAMADRLFEPLLTTKPSGLGLGLVTARELVERQGGSLRCAHLGPPGARFEVRLPVG